MSIPMIVDTDAGVDDAVALMLLLRDATVDLKAVTTVSGNVPVHKVTRNIGLLVSYFERDIPIYGGSALPLWGPSMDSEDLMGEDGLGGASAHFERLASTPKAESAAAALVRLTRDKAPTADSTLLAIGPLTNLALAVRLDPGFAARVPHLVVMGGAVHGIGNMTAAAEFNILADPEAARIVFSAGFPRVTVFPWETCIKTSVPWKEYERLTELKTADGRLFTSITRSMAILQKDQFHSPGFLVPDLYAAALAVSDDYVTLARPGFLEVDDAFGSGRGLTSVRWNLDQGSSANVRVVEEFDLEKLLQALTKALGG
jgi:purine nucleosidase